MQENCIKNTRMMSTENIIEDSNSSSSKIKTVSCSESQMTSNVKQECNIIKIVL